MKTEVWIWSPAPKPRKARRPVVTHRPCLQITEVMAWPANDQSSGHYDWFELSNCGTCVVDLRGYRFFDTESFAGAFTITNSILLQPGESVVFVEQMTPEEFQAWWGPENMPSGFRVYTYHGFSLWNFGEALYLWNEGSLDLRDTVATTSWLRANPGVSLECENFCGTEDDPGCNGMCLIDSVLGLRGAFRTAVSGDIGSPGSTSNLAPRILTITFDGSSVLLRCRGVPGKTYHLMSAPTLAEPSWVELETQTTYESILSFEDGSAGLDSCRFYRLEETE